MTDTPKEYRRREIDDHGLGKSQRLNGYMVVWVEDLNASLKRIESACGPTANPALSTFNYDAEATILGKRAISLTCAAGNMFYLIQAPKLSIKSLRSYARHEGGGGAPLGFAQMAIYVKSNTVKRIGDFYSKYFNPLMSISDDGKSLDIVTGPYQVLTFVEDGEKARDPDYYLTHPREGSYHICIYINNFDTVKEKLEKDNLIYKPFKSVYFDEIPTIKMTQIRLVRICDVITKELLLCLEHEVRSEESAMNPMRGVGLSFGAIQLK
jgi:hypothetical protein